MTNTNTPPTSAANYAYNAWGIPYGSVSTFDNPYQYGGKVGYYPAGNTGAYIAGARVYHPYIMRWLQRDPIGFDGGYNLYEYVGSNPVGFVDPTGRDRATLNSGQDSSCFQVIGSCAAVGATAGAIAGASLSCAGTACSTVPILSPGGGILGGSIGATVGAGYCVASSISNLFQEDGVDNIGEEGEFTSREECKMECKSNPLISKADRMKFCARLTKAGANSVRYQNCVERITPSSCEKWCSDFVKDTP